MDSDIRIRPSKMQANSLAKMLKGNRDFVLVDDQKVVYGTDWPRQTGLATSAGRR